ncbi:hypothetical protein RYX36_011002 [Vicia faba]
MDFTAETAYHMFCDASLITLEVDDQSVVFSLLNLPRRMNSGRESVNRLFGSEPPSNKRKAFKEEKESHRELKKEDDAAVNNCIMSSLDAFYMAIKQLKVLYPGIEIPLKRMGMQKRIVDREIVSDRKEVETNGEEVEESEKPNGEA